MKKQYTLNELNSIAKLIVKKADSNILLFYGTMGVGKTTLIKEIVKELGVSETVSSPTFSLVNEYHTQTGESVYHFDFYRIDSEEEALDIGVEEYFYSDAWCLIEWPENVENLVPLKSVKINITTDSDELRTIELTNNE